jgi:Fe-S-cluster containining protein
VDTTRPTTLPLLPAEPLGAASAFAYECRRCLRCCTGKRIRVNPYEVLRLARRVGTSTTEFLARFTIEGGTELARMEDERCVFLTGSGCGVHADRPLVCRLYPLGRHVKDGEPDRYVRLESHPESEGEFNADGTVAAYLDGQGAAPFMRAADRYLDLVVMLSGALARAGATEAATGDDAVAWLDIDAVLASSGAAPAASTEDAMQAHCAALEEWSRAPTSSSGVS